jgi:hypothetical protein
MVRCPGRAVCSAGVLSECVAPAEACNESDDDCDGEVDEDFRNAVGGYADLHHCGACGVDCSLSPVPEGDLVCGGDPFAPTCVLSCPDTLDGIQPGDRVDGDRDVATGCECTVSALNDVPGPVGAVGQALDVNCDGADGEVPRSFYVATDGSDTGPGSPTRPLATVGAALLRALDEGRADVFIASGTYVEALALPSGVRLHGGYRRDFLALDPEGFTTILRAPLDSPLPGGAALASTDCASGDTVVEWLSVRGRDAIEPSSPTVAIWLACTAGGRSVRLDTLDIRPGVPGSGASGVAGQAGASPATPPLAGDPPRGAVESGRTCTRGSENLVDGGERRAPLLQRPEHRWRRRRVRRLPVVRGVPAARRERSGPFARPGWRRRPRLARPGGGLELSHGGVLRARRLRGPHGVHGPESRLGGRQWRGGHGRARLHQRARALRGWRVGA